MFWDYSYISPPIGASYKYFSNYRIGDTSLIKDSFILNTLLLFSYASFVTNVENFWSFKNIFDCSLATTPSYIKALT